MRLLRNCLAVLLPALSFLFAQAQSPETILDSLRPGRKPEKLFTHFDKSLYQPGETIWFKTYITVDGLPGNYSTAAKAELLDENGRIINSQILPVAIGTISGSIVIPPTLPYNTYVFRLYTQHMLNTGSNDYYYKLISVLPSASQFVPDQPIMDKSIRFFPESNTFLADELNILAFKAVDERGKPTSLTGTIKDSKGTEIVSFATEFNGMGRIEITPKKGERYTAEYTDPSGKTKSSALPLPVEEGTNLIVLDEVFKKRLIVNSRSSSAKPAYILGEMDQTMVFKIDITAGNGHYMGRVPMQDLPGGLLHIGVFTTDHQLLAERTCFVNSRHDTSHLIIDPVVVTNLTKRGENEFEFMLPDSLEGVFSVAVTDERSTRLPVSNENILAATLITGNLKGIINPFYELGQLTGDVKNDAVDLLLLTHEYKWNWQQLRQLSTVKPPVYPDNFIPFRGIASSDKTNKFLPQTNLRFIITTKDSATNFFSATTDDKGYFEVPGMVFEDSASLHVQSDANRDRDKKVKLEILSPSLDEKYNVPAKTLPPGLIPAFMKVPPALQTTAVKSPQKALDIDTTGQVMQEVIIESKVKPTTQVEKRYTRGLFTTSARTSIDFINNKPTYLGGNIFDYLKGRYSYLQVMGTYPNYSLVFRGMRSLGTGAFITAAVFLDEMPVNVSTLLTVPMMDIALVRIYGPGVVSSSGAVAIYTKRGQDVTTSSSYSNVTSFGMVGFSKPGMFLSPDYSKNASNSIKQDNRSTLLWDPTISYLPEDGKAQIRFFNSDDCKEYKIVVQGFTTGGKLIYWEKIVKQ